MAGLSVASLVFRVSYFANDSYDWYAVVQANRQSVASIVGCGWRSWFDTFSRVHDTMFLSP